MKTKRIEMINTILMSLVVGIAGILIVKWFKPVKKIDVKPVRVYTIDTKEQNKKDNVVITGDEVIYDYFDGSWVDIKPSENHYEFQKVEKGDWSNEFKSLDELQKNIDEYYSQKLGQKAETTI